MKKTIALLLLLTMVACFMTSCTIFNNSQNPNVDDTARIKIAYMSGPTGMGMAKLIHDNGGIDGNEKYTFIKYEDASLATADLLTGKIDMACLPTNTAATLYNKQNQKVQVLALNCLNSLYIMTKTGTTIESLSDLEGKTIYTIANGTPAVILRHLLTESGINATVKTEKENGNKIATPSDLANALIAEGSIEIALVPEPVATAAPLKIASLGKDYTYSVAIKLDDAWESISDTPVAMGCIVGTREFVSSNKSIVNSFLSEYEKSINYIADADNLESSAAYIVESKVMDAAPAAKKSLTNLGAAIAYKDSTEMKNILSDFYSAIGVNMIGGALPADDFYYEK